VNTGGCSQHQSSSGFGAARGGEGDHRLPGLLIVGLNQIDPQRQFTWRRKQDLIAGAAVLASHDRQFCVLHKTIVTNG
jgi:hypothetical protein